MFGRVTPMGTDDIPALIAAMRDERYEVWAPASLALISVRDTAAVPELLDALAIPHARMRCAIALTLGLIGDRRATEALIALLRTGSASVVWENERACAAEALGALGDARAVEPLIAALSDSLVGGDEGTAHKALAALGRLGDPRAVEPLIAATRAMRNPSGATILGNLGDRRAVEPLLADLEALRAPHLDAQSASTPWYGSYYYYAIRALGKLGDPRAVPLLEWIRDHETAPVLKGKSLADMAVKALARIAERQSAA